MKEKRIKKLPKMSPIALRTLTWLLAPIAADLLVSAFAASSLDTYSAFRLYPLLAYKAEHTMMALLLAVGGTLVLDISLKRK